MNNWKEQYNRIMGRFEEHEKNKIPLCAAETYTSDYSLNALSSHIEGLYGFNTEYEKNDFIGGDIVVELKNLASDLCKTIFNSEYVNVDTMTGMSCITYTIMSLLKNNDKVLITTPNQGGHPSLPMILETLNISYDEIPYNFQKFQIDYDKTNFLIKTNRYDAIIFCQSDLIYPPQLKYFDFPKDLLVIYDCTQILGHIAGNALENPLDRLDKIVLVGGTHKTLPAPSCGIIITNKNSLIEKLKYNISPKFLRYIQPNHIAGLILALIEFKEFGHNYCNKINTINRKLSDLLVQKGFQIAKISDTEYSKTHQIFILTSEEVMNIMFNNAHKFNITLNKKNKQLFNNYGIRLGVQQISQYDWQKQELENLAELLYSISQENPNVNKINTIRKTLISKKIPVFSYDICVIE